jgi:hypothetical protein
MNDHRTVFVLWRARTYNPLLRNEPLRQAVIPVLVFKFFERYRLLNDTNKWLNVNFNCPLE